MKTALFVPVALVAATLASCRTAQPSVETLTEVRYETRYVERLVTDTLLVEIPAQTASNVTPADSSHLETDFATSDAWTDSEGLLHHTLANKAQKRPVEFQRPEVEKETTATEKEQEKIKEPVYIEKELTRWQEFRLAAFGWLVGAVALLLLWVLRKPAWVLIKRFLLKTP